MILIAAWILAALGAAHVLLGLVWFHEPILAAFSEGGFGKFGGIDSRRVAFWFTILGVPLMGLGHVAILAATAANFALIKTIGFYLLALSVVGILALLRPSGFWAVLPLAAIFIWAGHQ